MLAVAHVRMRLLILLAQPPPTSPGTLAMPSVILIFLGIGLADTSAEANAIMASFTVFRGDGGRLLPVRRGHRGGPGLPLVDVRTHPARVDHRPPGRRRHSGPCSSPRPAAGLVILVAHVLHAGRARRRRVAAPRPRAAGGQRAARPSSASPSGTGVSSRAALPIAKHRLSRPRVRRRPVPLSAALSRPAPKPCRSASCRGTSPSSPGGPSQDCALAARIMALGRGLRGAAALCSPVGAIAERRRRAVPLNGRTGPSVAREFSFGSSAATRWGVTARWGPSDPARGGAGSSARAGHGRNLRSRASQQSG